MTWATMTSPTYLQRPRRTVRWLGSLATLSLVLLSAVATAHTQHEHTAISSDRLTRAQVAQSAHDFAHALALTYLHLQSQPFDDRAWLQLAALHLIRGEHEEATKACAKIRQMPIVVMVTCNARIAHASGNSARFDGKLETLLAQSKTDSLTPALRAWTLSVAGDLALASGRDSAAEALYRRSLTNDDNPQVRASLADLLIEARSWKSAVALIGDAPASLTLHVQRLIVRRNLGLSTGKEQHRLHHQFQHWLAAGDYEHAREMARFYLDVADDRLLAREIAEINARLQHEPEDAKLLQRTRDLQ